MASSSVSQESLDTEDFEISARKSRIRNQRARNVNALPRNTEREREEDDNRDTNDGQDSDEITPIWSSHNTIPEHESPSRCILTSSRPKDKRTRPNHLHKGKLPKDKRKLREKRRSTGVPGIGASLAHLVSTESTGDSLDDEDEEGGVLHEAKRNTAYNEVIDADNPQTPAEDRRPKNFPSRRRNKSPSDLEADLEDNQDYDSAVSQSEPNPPSIIGKRDSTHTIPQSSILGKVPSVLSRFQNHESTARPFIATNESKPNFSVQSSINKYQTNSSVNASHSHHQGLDNPPERVRPVASILARYQAGTRTDSDSSSPVHRYRRDNLRLGTGSSGDQESASVHSTSHLTKEINEGKQKLLAAEKSLESEREENQRLKDLLAERDTKIEELEKEVFLLNQDLEDFDSENQKLVLENNALIRAVSQMSTTV